MTISGFFGDEDALLFEINLITSDGLELPVDAMFDTITKPSTAKCDLNTYTLFLLAESKHPGCTRLAEIMGDLSHDSVNRFFLREQYEPKDLFDEVSPHINLIGGTII